MLTLTTAAELVRKPAMSNHSPRSGDHGSRFRLRDLCAGASGLLFRANPVFRSANLICRHRSTSLSPLSAPQWCTEHQIVQFPGGKPPFEGWGRCCSSCTATRAASGASKRRCGTRRWHRRPPLTERTPKAQCRAAVWSTQRNTSKGLGLLEVFTFFGVFAPAALASRLAQRAGEASYSDAACQS